jgi:2-oxoglutarate dehydrogenase E2 component (dihydrolipoamide succinyltransferase)
MPITVTMPQMGESVVEGTVERWCVEEGERIEKDQTLCEITTDKVDAEIPAPETGVVTRILVAPGTTVEVGAELCELDPAGAAAKAAEKVVRAAEPRERAAPAAPEAPAAAAPAAERRRTSPLARRMAEAHGVDLEQVEAGEAGRITAEQVAAHARATPARGAPAAAPPGSVAELLARYRVPQYRPREGDRVTPFSTIRKRIAEHMVVSKIVSPHVGTVAEVDFHKIVELRKRVRGEFERTHGIRLSYLPFVVQATVKALRDYPQLNSTVIDETIVERQGIHIGVAVETERGLLVPVIRDTDRLSLVGIAQAIQDLAERARSRQIGADELQGGTFTVTNPGREGNLYGFAVINQPQVGILRTGELKKRPVVIERDGEESIAIHPMMYLALSYDHRIIDGVTGNGFLYRVAKLLEAGEFEI